MLIPALSIIKGKKWKQPNVHQLMNGKQNVVHPHGGIRFNHERNEELIHGTMWMDLEDVMLKERSQTLKDTYGMIPLI